LAYGGHLSSSGTGAVHADLADAELRHGRKRVARLMRAAGLAGKSPRRWQTTTIADSNAGQRPDLVRRDFSTDPADAPDRYNSCAATVHDLCHERMRPTHIYRGLPWRRRPKADWRKPGVGRWPEWAHRPC
jgi:hypothetical protein